MKAVYLWMLLAWRLDYWRILLRHITWLPLGWREGNSPQHARKKKICAEFFNSVSLFLFFHQQMLDRKLWDTVYTSFRETYILDVVWQRVKVGGERLQRDDSNLRLWCVFCAISFFGRHVVIDANIVSSPDTMCPWGSLPTVRIMLWIPLSYRIASSALTSTPRTTSLWALWEEEYLLCTKRIDFSSFHLQNLNIIQHLGLSHQTYYHHLGNSSVASANYKADSVGSAEVQGLEADSCRRIKYPSTWKRLQSSASLSELPLPSADKASRTGSHLPELQKAQHTHILHLMHDNTDLHSMCM